MKAEKLSAHAPSTNLIWPWFSQPCFKMLEQLQLVYIQVCMNGVFVSQAQLADVAAARLAHAAAA